MERKDNFSKYLELRKQFPWFSYDSCRYYFTKNSLELRYSFSLSGKYSFTPGVSVPVKKGLFESPDNLSASALENLVFHTGMIELISYWKAACPPNVIIRPVRMEEQQVRFWKKVFYNGLGEFFYLNSIQATRADFMEISFEQNGRAETFGMKPSGKSLIPVGGGKDSAVSMGVLNSMKTDWVPFIINPSRTTREVVGAAGKRAEETLDFTRKIDPQLLRLNAEGFLNGHTPFSALLAFYSLLAAYLTNCSQIVLSNESSANEPTVPGTSINHQYSKTFGFENDFREYYTTYISGGFNYFSLLRPLPEYQIARLFAGMPEFHRHFRSCNVGSKTNSWCGHCPKCLFTFIILSPFMEPAALIKIFGRNLLDDPSLEPIFNELNGKAEIKPFECIGTVDEINFALDQAILRYNGDEMPYLLKVHAGERRQSTSPGRGVSQKPGMSGEHFVPGPFLSQLEKML